MSEQASLRPRHSPTKTLTQLVRDFDLEPAPDVLDGELDGLALHGVTLNTADVHDGDLFVGLAGANRHGAEFAASARSHGAVALLTDAAGAELARTDGEDDLPTLITDDPRAMLGRLSKWVYDTDGRGPRLFGVTGTNGKTSTVHFLEAILRQIGALTGLSSTAERHIGDLNIVSGLTTPEATELHALLARMREDGVDACALEVSAQALTRHRVDGVVFDVAGFTNLSHDHLDDYGDMQNYYAAKAALFQPDRARRAVISLDSQWAEPLLREAGVPVTTISAKVETEADWHVTVTEEDPYGVRFRLESRTGESVTTRVPVIGGHMAANAGLAIVMLIEGGYELNTIRAALDAAEGIDVYLPGRSERVSGDAGPSVFVDFGHSPDAFETTLEAVREVTPGRVIMVFGADGDRDATKRPAMAQTAVAGSDVLIITDHHPRFENPDSIRAALLAAARAADPDHITLEVANPKLAIREAVRLAVEGDSILWAGPGHQNYRDIRGIHVSYSARAEARAALREAGWLPRA